MPTKPIEKATADWIDGTNSTGDYMVIGESDKVKGALKVFSDKNGKVFLVGMRIRFVGNGVALSGHSIAELLDLHKFGSSLKIGGSYASLSLAVALSLPEDRNEAQYRFSQAVVAKPHAKQSWRLLCNQIVQSGFCFRYDTGGLFHYIKREWQDAFDNYYPENTPEDLSSVFDLNAWIEKLDDDGKKGPDDGT